MSERSSAANAKARKYIINNCHGDYPKCALCDGVIDLTLPPDSQWSLEVDHIIPLAEGGGNNIDNFQPVHKKCNRLKGSKMINRIVYDRISEDGCKC